MVTRIYPRVVSTHLKLFLKWRAKVNVKERIMKNYMGRPAILFFNQNQLYGQNQNIPEWP